MLSLGLTPPPDVYWLLIFIYLFIYLIFLSSVEYTQMSRSGI